MTGCRCVVCVLCCVACGVVCLCLHKRTTFSLETREKILQHSHFSTKEQTSVCITHIFTTDPSGFHHPQHEMVIFPRVVNSFMLAPMMVHFGPMLARVLDRRNYNTANENPPDVTIFVYDGNNHNEKCVERKHYHPKGTGEKAPPPKMRWRGEAPPPNWRWRNEVSTTTLK